MKTQIFWVCASALAVGACSFGDDDQAPGALPPVAGMGNAGAVAPPAGPPVANPGAPIVGAGGTSSVMGSAGAAASQGGSGAPGDVGTGTAGGGPVAMAGTGAPTAGAGGMEAPMGDYSEPIIPEVTGECPEFTSGTKTIDGLGGIVFNAGAKKEGTGALIFYWHGTGSSALEVGNIPAAAQQEITSEGGVIVSFGRSKGTGGDCSGTATFSLDDFKVADIIVACAVKNHGINPKRIYTTGCSAGGLQAGCMGIQRSSYIAATAPNSGGVTIGYGKIQDPNRVPAVMTMHGGAGDWVIVSFPQTSEAYDNYMTKAGSFVINCDHGGSHCGAPASLQQSAWEFMKAHPFGTKPSPYAGGLPMGFHSSCKIWTPTERQPLGEGMAAAAPAMP